MPVDKFGRSTNNNGTQKMYVNQSAVSKNGDSMKGNLDMNNFRLTGLPDSLPDEDSDAVSWAHAIKLVRDSESNCLDLKVSKTGDIMSGDLILSAAGDNDRVMGCTNLELERTFSVPLGTNTNKLHFCFEHHPIVLETDNGFLIKARNENVCQLGTRYDPSEIMIYNDIRMNSKRITNLLEPRLPHEVANKLYVDNQRIPKKILQGYVPSIKSVVARAENDKFGFVVTASSFLGASYKPTNAFNGVYSRRNHGAGGEWASRMETRNFWIQIKCPDPVLLWRIALRGRDTNNQRIYRWRLEGSTERNDGETYTTLLEPENPTYIGNEVQYFPVDTIDEYDTFRLFCLEAEEGNPGLSYMQLYVYSA